MDADKIIPYGSIAHAIVSLRKSRGITQGTLSKELGIKRNRLAQWERDTYKPPPKILLMLAEMVPESERQWWRDKASERADINLDETEAISTPLFQRVKKATDEGLMAQAVVAVEARILQRGLGMTLMQKAQVYCRVYDDWQGFAERTDATVDRRIDEVVCPINTKGRKK